MSPVPSFILLPPPEGTVITQCLSVQSFVHDTRDFSKKCESDFHNIWLRCSVTVLDFTANIGEVKVKGQNRHIFQL